MKKKGYCICYSVSDSTYTFVYTNIYNYFYTSVHKHVNTYIIASVYEHIFKTLFNLTNHFVVSPVIIFLQEKQNEK